MDVKTGVRLIAGLILLLALSGCTSMPGYDYTALNAAKPASILVLPPQNNSPDVKATAAVLAQMTYPLAETGYYVVPVALMDVAFKENGITTAADAQAVNPAKLRSIFGADAALYTEITEYGTSYQLLQSETAVTLKTRLVDLRTGALLWEGSARASSTEQQNNSSGGLVGMLVQAVVDQIANNISDAAFSYAGTASNRLLMPRYNGLLYGPRSPWYGKPAAH
jgi:hypothetical protein